MRLCSHPYKKDCPGCQVTREELMEDPIWAEKIAEAKAAGLHTCVGCGFRYFRTTDSCPQCNKIRTKFGVAKHLIKKLLTSL